jgi:8-oxo-dGTP diphosphatase
MKKLIKVVAAVIEDEDDKILCALRSPSMPMPDMWEFPGGKVEKNEDIYTALQREIKEELNCIVSTDGKIYLDIIHEYDSFIINLISIKAKIINGVPIPNEHSRLIWLKKDKLRSLSWAPADIPTVEKLLKLTNK